MRYNFNGSLVEKGITVRVRDIVDIVEDAGDWYLVSFNGEVRIEYDYDV